jgi:hypothetical protein
MRVNTWFVAVAVLLAATAVGADEPPAAAPAEASPRIEGARISVPPTIEGTLDDQAWPAPPLSLGEWITYNPSYGEKLVQRTEVWVAYDDKHLYFAFRCHDPEPDKVRANLSRRDELFNDDWVGLSLDSVAAGQSSYDMFVNARGVQADILNSSSAGEQIAPDWVWDSAARPTSQGYDAEIRLPLKSIRFKSGRDIAMGVMFWRRVSRLGQSASWPDVPQGKAFIERHATLVVHDLKAPLTLEVIPSATWSTNQARTSPTAFGPVDSEPDAGVSVKYGVTSSTTLEGTVNPDFSQVESDAFQVQVNQRFPIFYPEKRPFFMEGMGTFELAGANGDANMRTAVHTRHIEDPIWGGASSRTPSSSRATTAWRAPIPPSASAATRSRRPSWPRTRSRRMPSRTRAAWVARPATCTTASAGCSSTRRSTTTRISRWTPRSTTRPASPRTGPSRRSASIRTRRSIPGSSAWCRSSSRASWTTACRAAP